MKSITLYVTFSAMALLIVAASGCTAKETVRMKTVAASNLCAGTQKAHSLQLVENEAQWQELFFTKIVFAQLPKPALPEVNFEKNAILLIVLDEKPTTGYTLQRSERPAVIENRQLIITVIIEKPEAGALQAQILTRPCLAIEIPGNRYDTIAVYDQNGKLFDRVITIRP